MTTLARSSRRTLLGAPFVLLASAALLAAPLAHGATFPFSSSFPGGPLAGPWAYVERDTSVIPPQETVLTNQTIRLYTGGGCAANSPCPAPLWNDPNQRNQVPSFSVNNSASNWQTYGGPWTPFRLPAKTLMAHPGNLLQAVVRFTVPAKPNGQSYTSAYLKSVITDEDFNGGNGVAWSVEHNGVVLHQGALQSTIATSLASATVPPQAFPVQTGDVIEVVIDAIGGDEFFDSTSISGAIVLM